MPFLTQHTNLNHVYSSKSVEGNSQNYMFLIGNSRTTIKLNHHEFEIYAIIRLLFSGDVELRFLLHVFKVRIRVELIV